MTKKLVIVESPTKAKTIKKMLGRNYSVIASVGHIRDLPKSKLGIDIENNFEPKYINIRGKGDLIKGLKKEAKNADEIYLATDPDREGEAISWHLSTILGINPRGKHRVAFNEITKDTVKKQLKSPRQIDMDLVDAQQARRLLDRLAGYKISPLLWKKVKNGLSAGRVQSVVLKMICNREEEIEEFKPEEYWTIEAILKKGRKSFKTKYYGELENNKISKKTISNIEESSEILRSIDKKEFEVLNMKKGSRKKNPPLPFTTSTLQQEASKNLGFSTKKTMMIAQRLYEGISIPKEGSVGLITYMRTDSTRMSNEARENLNEFIKKQYGLNYIYNNLQKTKSNIQDAHECIRPTKVFRSPVAIKDSLSKDEFKLYSLIWQRFVSSQMQPAIYDTVNLDIVSNKNIFKASGSQIKFDGFLRIYNYSKEKDNILPDLEEGDKLKASSIENIQHFTQPPARYNEASLIKLLEDKGIGRPSTYAPIITTLLSRYYVVIEEKKIVPTELGILVNDILIDNFSDLINEKFTADMESYLDKVSVGEMNWKEVVGNFYNDLDKDLKIAESKIEKVEIKEEVTDQKCEKCGRNMVVKIGRFGKFLACPGFPECKNAKSLVEKIDVKCNKCGGEIVIKRSKKGRVFYGCEKFPKCDFVSWNRPIGRECPLCGDALVEVKVRKENIIKCNNATCNYREEVENK